MLKIEFTTDGAAFGCEDDPLSNALEKTLECHRILRDITRKLENGYTCGSCMDINGNKVGTWSLD